jgi:hypothetical protein
MAIKMTRDSKLRVVFQTGLNEEGKPIYKTKSYPNVAEEVTPDQLQQVGEALASLSTYPMGGIQQSLLHEVL